MRAHHTSCPESNHFNHAIVNDLWRNVLPKERVPRHVCKVYIDMLEYPSNSLRHSHSHSCNACPHNACLHVQGACNVWTLGHQSMYMYVRVVCTCLATRNPPIIAVVSLGPAELIVTFLTWMHVSAFTTHQIDFAYSVYVRTSVCYNAYTSV